MRSRLYDVVGILLPLLTIFQTQKSLLPLSIHEIHESHMSVHEYYDLFMLHYEEI
jgi:hypothetical protein